ncbi:transposable element Tcb2 transposase [Trichonephila clavipes]|nr:transposable element Tcb2 transposase [Trichonephila clavipes]
MEPSPGRREGRLLTVAAREGGARATLLFNDKSPPPFEALLRDFGHALGLGRVKNMSTPSGRQVRSISQLKNEFQDIDTFFLDETASNATYLTGRAEVDMPLRRFRRQYEQLSQFERGRILGMMEVGWSARRVVRQLGRSDCVVRRCWDQWIREMSFTRRPGPGRSRLTSRREDRHIVRNVHIQPTASLAVIQAQVAPSLGDPVSSQTIRRRLAEGHLGLWRPLRVLPLTPTHRHLRLEW